MRSRFMTAAAIGIFVAGLPQSSKSAEFARVAQVQKTPVSAEAMKAQQPTGRPHLYTHAKVGFTVAVPPSAEVVERKDADQISIRSRKGFVINLQTGPARPSIPLSRMSALLEAKYLGQGKPWSLRGADKPTRIGGMPAHEVLYEGAASRAKVVVARGAKRDYVFIFIAPETDFLKLSGEFDWVLTHFRPSAGDLSAPGTPPEAMQAAAGQRFSEPGYGYVIEYPAAWEMSKPTAMAAMFSGREGTPEYAAIIGVQNIAPPGAQNAGESVKRTVNQLTSSLGNAVRGFRVVDDKAWTYVRGNLKLHGRQLFVVYTHAGESFKKRMIIIPRPDGSVSHVWSYTAPNRQFAALSPVAERMLHSWTILTDRRQ